VVDRVAGRSVVISRGFSAIIQFLLVLTYSANLELSAFGELSILMICLGVAYGLIDFGVTNKIITTTTSKRLMGSLQSLNLVIAICISSIAVLVAYISAGETSLSREFYCSLAISPFALLFYSTTVVPYARLHKAMRLNDLALVDLIPVVAMGISVLFLLFLGMGLLTFVLATLLQVVVRFFMLRLFYGSMLRHSVIREITWNLLLRQYGSNLVIYFTSKLDQIMVSIFVGIEIFAHYSFLKQILNYPVSILIAIYSQITFPFYSRNRLWLRKIKWIAIKSLILLICLMMLYFTVLMLIPFYLVEDHFPAWGFSSSLAILIMLLSLGRIGLEVFSALAVGVGRVVFQLKLNIIYLGITFLMGLLIPIIGVESYVSGICAITILTALSTYWVIFSGSKDA
jgi:O-antigen/teichoic acid export membrane protein